MYLIGTGEEEWEFRIHSYELSCTLFCVGIPEGILLICYTSFLLHIFIWTINKRDI